jgi:hypothetical protein
MIRETIAAGMILLLGGGGYAAEGASPVAECVSKSGEAYVSARGELLNTAAVNSLRLAGEMPSWWVDSIVWRSQHPQEAKQFDDIVAKYASWFDKVYKDKDGLDPEWLSQKQPEFLTMRSPAEAAVWETTTQGFPPSLWIEWATKIRPDWPVALRRELVYSVGVFCDRAVTDQLKRTTGKEGKPQIVDPDTVLRWLHGDLAKSPDATVRLAVVWALRSSDSESARATLEQALGDENVSIQPAAAIALMYLPNNDGRGAQAIEAWLAAQKDAKTRHCVIQQLWRLGPLASDIVSSVEKSGSSEEQAQVKDIRDRVSFDTVFRCITDLGATGGYHCETALLDLSNSDSAFVRRASIGGLDRLGNPKAVQRLREMAEKDEDAKAKEAAREAVARRTPGK